MGRSNNLVQVAAYLAAFGNVAEAFWRLPCRGTAAYARIDPLVDTGVVSGHVHSIAGSSGLGLASTAADMLNGDCTSCAVLEDMSNYWSTAMYFVGDDGTMEMVSQAGGMLVYYLLNNNPGEKITAFPNGFGMLAGDPHRRNFTCQVPEPPKSDWTGFEVSQAGLSQKALGFNCLNYVTGPTEPSLFRHQMPEKDFMDRQCVDGLRLELMFPSCWDGKSLDSPDHKSHIQYPDAVMSGNCPEGYTTRTPGIFFETIWNTQDFAGRPGKFVLSNGDATGNGNHGDLVIAWHDGVLQQAADTCTDLSGEVSACPLFTLQDDGTQEQCKIPIPSVLKGDNPMGPMKALLGNNPITYGPEPAGGDDDAASLAAAHGGEMVGGLSDKVQGDAQKLDVKVPAEAPAPTAAPVAPAADAAGNVMATKWVTDGANVWQIFVEEEIKTVTADQAPSRRHIHHNHHRAGLQ